MATQSELESICKAADDAYNVLFRAVSLAKSGKWEEATRHARDAQAFLTCAEQGAAACGVFNNLFRFALSAGLCAHDVIEGTQTLWRAKKALVWSRKHLMNFTDTPEREVE